MTLRRFLIFAAVVLFIASGTYCLIKIAKGYRFSLSQRGFEASGLLVATSTPDGAAVYLNGKLQSATNTTLYLPPATYKIEIKKDGFRSWEKTIKIEKEYVAKTEAWLFPLVPNFQALTYTGAQRPLLSPDGSKVIYQVESKQMPEKNGLWILDLTDMPFGISREPKQIAKNTLLGRDFTTATYLWSPDSRQVLISFTGGKTEENFLLDTGNLNLTNVLTDVSLQVSLLKKQWETEKQLKQEQKMAKLPPVLVEILQKNVSEVLFAPDETKIAYLATGSATIPDNLIPSIHSFSNQPQERTLKPNQTYVYDFKEDRNYVILPDHSCALDYLRLSTPTPSPATKLPSCLLAWVPNSRHLFLAEKDKVSLLEYEGTNLTTVYEGSYQFPFAFMFPAASRILLLTTLTNAAQALTNLYAVSLR